MENTMAGSKKGKLGKFPILACVTLELGLVGLIIPLNPAMGYEERTQTVLNIMAQATSNFDMVPPKVLDRIEEVFYQGVIKVDQKFDYAIPLRSALDFNRCFRWNHTLLKWEIADANMTLIKFTGNYFMLIAKIKEEQSVEV